MEKSRENIIDIVKNFIDGHRLIEKGDRILLSLSAGKDSMALLNIMLNLKNYYDIDLGIFHLNHLMRGAESDDDEIFVQEAAKKNNLKFYFERFDFKEQKQPGSSFEEFARIKRYELLNIVSRDNGFNRIATAHSRDDNIETIAMRIFKGTGIHGLKGIKIRNNDIIRPLLCLTAEMIYGYLRENGIAWRDDSSNKDNKYLRNFTRNQLLPDIRVHFKNSGNALLSLSRTSYEYTSLIDDLLTEKYKILFKIKDDVVIIKSDRFIRDKRIFKYIIAKAIRENFKLNVSYGMLEEIYKNAIIEKSHLNLFANNRINIKKTILNGETVVIVSKGGPDRQNSNEWEYTLDIKSIDNTVLKIGETGKNIQVSVVGYQFFTENFKNKKYIFIEINDNNQNFIIRNRRSGDKIKLKSGTKKIKNLFIDAKLNAGTKDIIPIFMVDAKIAAIMTGFIDNSLKNRVSSDFYVSDKSKKILAIQRI